MHGCVDFATRSYVRVSTEVPAETLRRGFRLPTRHRIWIGPMSFFGSHFKEKCLRDTTLSARSTANSSSLQMREEMNILHAHLPSMCKARGLTRRGECHPCRWYCQQSGGRSPTG